MDKKQFAVHAPSSTMKFRVIPARARTIHDYFTEAYGRTAGRIPPGGAAAVHSEDGLQASFSLSGCNGRIGSVQYACSTCVTLVGLCEHLSRVVVGMKPDDAHALTPEALLRWHPEIPRERHGRARLAITALRSGLAAMDNGGHT